MNEVTPTPPGSDAPPSERNQPFDSPVHIPDYELLERIGRGSYGEVWRVRNVLGQFRAVKVIFRDRFSSPRPFERELEGIQRFEPISRSHPRQLHILHVGKNEAEGYFYYAMELADAAAHSPPTSANPSLDASRTTTVSQAAGCPVATNYRPRTLRHDLEHRGLLPIDECIQIGTSLATALQHLHEQGLVHRDIKPSNVLFVNGMAKLGDIGLVTEAGDTQSIVGTEGYLAPEGSGTPQSDLYSLGKVLYEICTGMDRHEFPRLPANSRDRPDARSFFEFNEVILRACDTSPQLRYSSALEMRLELEQLGGGASIRQARRRERTWCAILRMARWGVAAACLLGLGMLFSRSRSATAPRAVERRSTNEVANRYFDLGLHAFEKLYAADAMNHFQKAIAADPYFARAHTEVALIHLRPEGGDDRKSYAAGRTEAELALKLDPSLPLAHIVTAWSRIFDGFRWSEAEHGLQRALELDPRWDRGHHAYAEFLKVKGRTNEAIAEMREALRCNPESVRIRQRFPYVLVAARRLDDAIREAEDAISMEPDVVSSAYYGLKEAWVARGDFPKAIATERRILVALRSRPESVEKSIRELETAFNSGGAKGYWKVELERARKLSPSSFTLATLYAQLDQPSEALECLHDSLKKLQFELVWGIACDWRLDPLRSDPAFREVLKALKLD